MLKLLWLVPAIPFAGALVLAVLGARMSHKRVTVVGVGTVAASAFISILIATVFLSAPPASGMYTQTLWTWIDVGSFRPQIAFYLDALSLVMILVVTFVSFLIHLYSAEFMRTDEGYSRFFAYMNLFVACMVTLLLADNLLLLYLGWEGVGLCSYLLIGFWYQDPVNWLAWRKAFIVTRVVDTAMAIGLFLLFHSLGTLRIQDLLHTAQVQWSTGSAYAIAAAALLLGGAVGKSAQLPLQTWLPDAMVGPTALTPNVTTRVLAASTVRQSGYMFLALGVGAWGSANFHFMTHAFFKALLFLAAGIIIEALHHEHNIFRMGGLRKELPVAFWTFLIAGCSLAGLPLITAGYYSKDLILWSAGSSAAGSTGLWAAGIAVVVLTSLYTFRLIFLVFFGPVRTPVTKQPGLAMTIPVWVLAVLSIV